MNVVVQPSDVLKVMQGIGATRNPVTGIGRIFGFSGTETEAGIPSWAWITVAVAGGIIIGAKYGHKIPVVRDL